MLVGDIVYDYEVEPELEKDVPEEVKDNTEINNWDIYWQINKN